MFEKEIIIDASNATLGRLASYAAKQALQGKKIIILNSEKAIVTGRKKFIITKYKERKELGGKFIQKGPYFSRSPEKIVKRTIRGMLPYKKGKGRGAFKRILCYKGIPEEYKDKKMFKAGKEKHTAYINIEEIARII